MNLLAAVVSIALAATTVLIHYETLRHTSALIARLPMAPRRRLLVVLACVFLAHTVEIWLHAVAYYGLFKGLHISGFRGTFHNRFPDFLYFSTETYTSLGFGDVYPLGGLRLIAGFETLTGLLMIGWSSSFTYLAMQKFWPSHDREPQ
jgi:hypothetical protein